MGLFPRKTQTLELDLPVGPYSNVYYVCSTNGSDSHDGLRPEKPLLTILAAYNKCTTGQHDVVAIIGGLAGNNLSAALDWSKSYTHLVGLCAPSQAAQRARIFQLSTLTGASPLLTVSGTGCIFKNFYIYQGVDDATSLINVSVTGGRNYFENVHFAGGGHATQAINGGASLKLDGGEECMFKNCTVGVDTIDAATGMVGLLVDGNAQRNTFEDCNFTMHAGNTGAAFVEIADNTAFDRYLIFSNCMFLNANANQFTMATGFLISAQTANRPCRIFLKDCMSYGITKNDADDRGVLMGNMNAVTAADLSGVAVEMVV